MELSEVVTLRAMKENAWEGFWNGC